MYILILFKKGHCFHPTMDLHRNNLTLFYWRFYTNIDLPLLNYHLNVPLKYIDEKSFFANETNKIN